MDKTMGSAPRREPILEATHEPEMEKLLAAYAVDQQAIRDLITNVEESHADHAQRDAYFSELAGHVERSFKQAETQLFPRTKNLKGLDLVSVAAQMRMRRDDMATRIGELT